MIKTFDSACCVHSESVLALATCQRISNNSIKPSIRIFTFHSKLPSTSCTKAFSYLSLRAITSCEVHELPVLNFQQIPGFQNCHLGKQFSKFPCPRFSSCSQFILTVLIFQNFLEQGYAPIPPTYSISSAESAAIYYFSDLFPLQS